MAKKATTKETKTTVAEKAAVKADSQAAVKETKAAAAKTTKDVKAEPAKTETKAAKTTKTVKETVKVELQFGGKNTTIDSIVDSIKEAYKAEGNKAAIKTLEVFVQPENNVAYYVINGIEEGKSVNF